MFNLITFSTYLVVASATTCTNEKRSLPQQPINNFPNFANYNGKTYASSAELTSLAHSSALQANTAVQNQQIAASHAVFEAKNNLAQAALGAAATAQAALVGKQVVVQNLKLQLQDAERQLQADISQYHQLQQVGAASLEAAKQAQQQVNVLDNVFRATQAGTKKTLTAAASAAALGTNQHEMVQKAKQQVAGLTQQLHNALADLQDVNITVKSTNLAEQNAGIKLEADSAVTLPTETAEVVVIESKIQEISANSKNNQN